MGRKHPLDTQDALPRFGLSNDGRGPQCLRRRLDSSECTPHRCPFMQSSCFCISATALRKSPVPDRSRSRLKGSAVFKKTCLLLGNILRHANLEEKRPVTNEKTGKKASSPSPEPLKTYPIRGRRRLFRQLESHRWKRHAQQKSRGPDGQTPEPRFNVSPKTVFTDNSPRSPQNHSYGATVPINSISATCMLLALAGSRTVKST
jgi:hypothetical protein